MFDEIENMKNALALVQRRAEWTLAHLDDDEAKCRSDLKEVLMGIHATAELALKGIVVA